MGCVIRVFITLFFSFLVLASTFAQSINDLQPGSYMEGDDPIIIDNDVEVIRGDDDFTGGFLEVKITNADSTDILSLFSDNNLSIAGNAVLWRGKRIGTIHHIFNGLYGNPFRINFESNSPIPYADFETGDLTSWRVDTSLNQMNGQSWAEGPDALGDYSVDKNPNVDDWAPNTLFPTESKAIVSPEAAFSGDFGLRLDVSARITSGFGTLHSPSVISDYFYAEEGDSISLWYNAANDASTDDFKDIFILIFRDYDRDGICDKNEGPRVLFHELGPANKGWKNLKTSLPWSSDILRFWFINGSYDPSEGQKVGCDLYIDDIFLKFNDILKPDNKIVESLIERITYFNECGDNSDRKFKVTLVNDGDTISSDGTITFISTPPVFTKVQDRVIYLNSDSCMAILQSYPQIVANDVCDPTYTNIKGRGKAGQYPLGSTVETWVATDGGGNTDTMSFTVTVIDTVTPEIFQLDDIVLIADPETCVATLSEYPEIIANKCSVSRILIEGKGEAVQYPLGSTTETWVAIDGSGDSDTMSFLVTVEAINRPPVIDEIEEIVAKENETMLIPLTGIGAGNDCVAQIVDSISAVIDDTILVKEIWVDYVPGNDVGSIRMTFAKGVAGIVNIRLTVQDNGGTANGGSDITIKEFTVVVEDVNYGPYVVNPLEDKEVVVGEILDIDIAPTLGEVFDDDDNDQMELNVSLDSGEELPPWGFFSGQLLTITPLVVDTGSYNIMVTAKDKEGLMASDTFKLQIVEGSTDIVDLEKFVFLKIYPNPTKGLVHIEINGNYHSGVDVRVVNIAGKEVYTKVFEATNLIQFDIGDCITGMYFIKLKLEGVEVVKKLVLE